MRARHYDPLIGRFIGEDSAQDGINWFVYGLANPTTYVDFDGHATLWEWDWEKIQAGWELVRFGVAMLRFSMRGFGKQIIADLRAIAYGPYGQKDQAEGISGSVAGLAALREGLKAIVFGTMLILDGMGLIDGMPPSPPSLPKV